MTLARFAPFALAAALAVPAGAVFAQAPSADPKAVQAGTYKLDPSHARVQFSVSHMGTSMWWGDFTGATGTLSIDPKAPAAAKLSVSIKTDTVTTTNAKLDGELKEWFEADKFPTITFVTTSVKPTAPGKALVTGDLTFHGVTKPVTLDTSFMGSGVNPMNKATMIGFNAKGHIKRSDFGVTKYVGMLGDDTELTISAPFAKQ